MSRDEASGGVAAAAATITEISNHLYSVVRGMMRRLRPVLLDEFGLVRALEELVDGWNERHADAFCRLATRGRLDDLGDAVNISVYRIVQECLTNATKHAHATEVGVDVERTEDGALRLAIADDGQGFEPGAAPRRPRAARHARARRGAARKVRARHGPRARRSHYD